MENLKAAALTILLMSAVVFGLPIFSLTILIIWLYFNILVVPITVSLIVGTLAVLFCPNRYSRRLTIAITVFAMLTIAPFAAVAATLTALAHSAKVLGKNEFCIYHARARSAGGPVLTRDPLDISASRILLRVSHQVWSELTPPYRPVGGPRVVLITPTKTYHWGVLEMRFVEGRYLAYPLPSEVERCLKMLGGS